MQFFVNFVVLLWRRRCVSETSRVSIKVDNEVLKVATAEQESFLQDGQSLAGGDKAFQPASADCVAHETEGGRSTTDHQNASLCQRNWLAILLLCVVVAL